MTGGCNYVYFTKCFVIESYLPIYKVFRIYIKCFESRRKIIRAVGLIVVIMNIPTGPSHFLFLDYNYEYSNRTKPLTILKFSVWVARSAEFVDRKSIKLIDLKPSGPGGRTSPYVCWVGLSFVGLSAAPSK